MRYIKIFIPVIFSVVFILSSCSELKNDIAGPEKVSVHGTGSLTQGSAEFHGKKLAANGLDDCRQCHARDFSGGTAKISCSTQSCHPTITVHKPGIVDQTSADFHGKFMKDNSFAMSRCAQCHGDSYTGGIASPTCENCHQSISVHKPGIASQASANFHGLFLKNKAMSMTQCKQCHGDTYAGGNLGPTCATCHTAVTIHKTGINDKTSANFHGTYIKNNSWNLALCSNCHGDNYAGGLASPTCNTCHSNPGGPEACNTCHGDFTNPAKPYPPNALNGATATTNPKVGAHALHMSATTNGKVTACVDCHKVPTKVSDAGHLGSDNVAELTFYTANKTGVGTALSAYDFSTNKCSNTYCHGNFELKRSNTQYDFIYTADKMGGLNKQVTWNVIDGSQTACGTCHGLPPEGHATYALNQCYVCHSGVMDNKGKIADKTKHVNGKVNVFGLEY